jgi:hypothetical protein
MIEHINPQPTEESPVIVEDYPYGWRQRTTARYWIETTKNGQRVVFQTKNPKTDRWNKPKKSTYSDIRILYRNTENDHIENDGLSFTYADAEDLAKFLANFPEETLTDYQKEQLKFFRAVLKTRKHVHVSIVENPTPEKQAEIEANNKKTSGELHQILQHYLNEGE